LADAPPRARRPVGLPGLERSYQPPRRPVGRLRTGERRHPARSSAPGRRSGADPGQSNRCGACAVRVLRRALAWAHRAHRRDTRRSCHRRLEAPPPTRPLAVAVSLGAEPRAVPATGWRTRPRRCEARRGRGRRPWRASTGGTLRGSRPGALPELSTWLGDLPSRRFQRSFSPRA
jgi:hypothetical protein